VKALVITRFTLQEAISRRLVLAGLLLSLVFLALFAAGFQFLYTRALESGTRSPGSLVQVFAGAALTVLGLYAVYFLSSFLALFLTVGAISGEVDSGTLHAVLARPISRAEYVAGRWLGFAILIVLYVAAMAGALLLLARLFAGYEPTSAERTIALMLLCALALLTLSLLGSTLLSTLANGVVVFSLFGLAWLAGIIEFVGDVLPNQSMIDLGIVVSLLIPSDALWRGASYYAQSPAFLLAASAGRGTFPFASLVPPALPFLIWSALYTPVLLLAAVLAFCRRDL